MLRHVAVACALLTLTVPTVAAGTDASSTEVLILECLREPGLVDAVQCYLDTGIDRVEAVLQGAVRDACILLFGEPC